MIGPVKNHFSVLVRNEFMIAVAIGVLVWIGLEDSKMYMLVFAGVLAWYMYLCYRAWVKTSFVFSEEGIVSDKNTMFRKTKNIPYTKLASVNLVKRISDRIFGTATLMFNANSGVNARRPEMSLCLKLDEANTIKAFVDSHLFSTVPMHAEAEEPDEGRITFGRSNLFLHAFFSLPTKTTLFSMACLGYSIVSLCTDRNAITIVTLATFFVSQIVPLIVNPLHYYGFSIYRDGDTINIQHGLITRYHTSFDVGKINAVRVKRPFFARLMHMACLEAEVVGINAIRKDVRPLLGLIMSEERCREVFNRLVPEFKNDIELQLQPRSARVPIILKAGISVAILSAGIAAAGILLGVLAPKLNELQSITLTTYMIFAIVVISVFLLATIYATVSSLKHKAFGCSDDMFVFKIGLLDRETVTMYYDMVQTVRYYAGPISRRYGLCKCTVSLLTAAGHSMITSGYFRSEDVKRIEERIFERIRSGEYYRGATSS